MVGMVRILLFLMIFTSGNGIAKSIDNIDLYVSYSALAESAIDHKILVEKEKYFSNQYLIEVAEDDKNTLFLLKITNYMKKVSSHFQRIENERGCLTVNGIGEDGEPISLFLEYKKERSLWLVNYIHISMLESPSEYVLLAKCPN